MAWLVRHGEPTAALDLVAELAPFAGRLRFLPRPSTGRAASDGTDALHRRTVDDTVNRLRPAPPERGRGDAARGTRRMAAVRGRVARALAGDDGRGGWPRTRTSPPMRTGWSGEPPC
ncbi:hypothetical protein ACRAWF_18800 [Streptomyces sp. L7]